MQDPWEDTEWNDILRRKGILPKLPKNEPLPEEFDQTELAPKYDEMGLDELDEFEDEEDQKVLEQYRQKRFAEMRALQAKSTFGEVREISANDWVDQVNKAGEGIWVVLHLYKQGIPMCSLLNQHISRLAPKFPHIKFLKSVAQTCIPNYPDKNLPTIFVYKEGDLKHQWIGPLQFGGMQLKCDDLEWIFHKAEILKSTLDKNPRQEVHDVMMSSIRSSRKQNDDSSDDDDY